MRTATRVLLTPLFPLVWLSDGPFERDWVILLLKGLCNLVLAVLLCGVYFLAYTLIERHIDLVGRPEHHRTVTVLSTRYTPSSGEVIPMTMVTPGPNSTSQVTTTMSYIPVPETFSVCVQDGEKAPCLDVSAQMWHVVRVGDVVELDYRVGRSGRTYYDDIERRR